MPHLVADPPRARQAGGKRIAVVGSGVSGLSCAWLLDRGGHAVTLLEADDHFGGHSNTVDAPTPTQPVAVDTGFIVFNEPNYPNLTAMLAHLDVRTKPAFMSFAVTLDGGALEYSTQGAALFAQKRNVASPAFWRMIGDVLRFQKQAPRDLPRLERTGQGLSDYLDEQGFGRLFRDAHLLPQAAAIWSSSLDQMRDYPAASFVRFYMNHNLLTVDTRPSWTTIDGGSRQYVQRLLAQFGGQARTNAGVVGVVRGADQAAIRFADGRLETFDAVVLATHSDQALRLLEAPSVEERALLSAIPYRPNRAVLHRDPRLMPKRRRAWAAWTHQGLTDRSGEGGVTYWMNLLQSLPGPDLFVSLNPVVEPDPDLVLGEWDYEHPVFNQAAVEAQKNLWSLQGRRHTWFAGAWFGAGFHEDGLQAGLAVAEQLGGVRRPWTVENESGRIHVADAPQPVATPARAARVA